MQDKVPSCHLDGGGSEHEVLAVAEGLGWSHDDRVPGVHAQRIEILHIAHLREKRSGVRRGVVRRGGEMRSAGRRR